jgi:hypothetical protein
MLPTLILYRNGEIKEQLVAWGTKQEGTLEGTYSKVPLVFCDSLTHMFCQNLKQS